MDKEKQREQAKLRMRRKRNKERNKTPKNVTQDGGNVTQVTPEVEMVTDQFGTRPRFLKLSDGQVFDRANLPKVTKMVARPEAIRMANRADGRVIDQAKADRYKRWGEDVRLEAFQDKKERERLQSICASLSGHKVLDEVYLGTRDPVPMSEVAELLTAFD